MNAKKNIHANLLYFASLYGINLFNCEKYLVECIEQNKISSPYYPHDLMFVCSMSRFAHVAKRDKIKSKLVEYLKLINYEDLTRIEKILYQLASSYCDIKLEKKYLSEVLSWEGKDGLLPPLPFCYSVINKKGVKTFSASKIITTALVLELLLKNSKFIKDTRKDIEIVDELPNLSNVKKQINLDTRNDLNVIELKKIISEKQFQKILAVPIQTALSIKKQISPSEKEIIDTLTLGMFYSWIGYTIADDILDGQRPKSLLNLAKKLKSTGFKYYEKLYDKSPQFKKEIIKAFKETDSIYLWEKESARFKKGEVKKILKVKWSYKYIEKRMQPYLVTLSSLADFLGKANFKKSLYQIFKSQVVVDQIGDDAHDWEEDFNNGRMTYVLYLLLKNPKSKKDKKITFWKETMSKVISICKKEYNKTFKSINSIDPYTDFFSNLIKKVYRPIEKADTGRNKVRRIISSLNN